MVSHGQAQFLHHNQKVKPHILPIMHQTHEFGLFFELDLVVESSIGASCKLIVDSETTKYNSGPQKKRLHAVDDFP